VIRFNILEKIVRWCRFDDVKKLIQPGLNRMNEDGTISEYIRALKDYEALSPYVVDHRELPGRDGSYSEPSPPLSGIIQKRLADMGIPCLYRHQAEAITHVRQGRHTVVATPTASGKTLIYTVPVLEKIIENPESRSL
jgi:DEAD/DEAH box helicase domain-containing protein